MLECIGIRLSDIASSCLIDASVEGITMTSVWLVVTFGLKAFFSIDQSIKQ
jgi:hypothetical protein